MKPKKTLYALIPLEQFKAILGIDDREEKLARFCLVSSTFTIEQYCKRRLLRKQHFERIAFYGDLLLPLREYPVREALAVYAMRHFDRLNVHEEERIFNHKPHEPTRTNGECGIVIEPEFYRLIPECGQDIDIPFSIEFSPAVKRLGCNAVKVVYLAGYSVGKAPKDLAAACLELAAWNMSRYRGRRVGMTGNIRGAGINGEHFEMSMPENVKVLLEPYKRKVI